MGLSANQAKLLTITARLSDNELRAQFITNAKVRLAESSNEATTEYMRALDSSDLMYSFYDADNQKNSMKLTAGALMTYGENKNQYGLINTAGQIMVSTTDKANFENSTTLVSFLQKYDALFSDRPLYIGDMAELYGENWPRYEDLGNIYKNYNTISGATDSKLNSIGAYSTDAEGKKDWEAKAPEGRDVYDEAVETYKNKMFTSSNGTAQDGGLVGALTVGLNNAKETHLTPYMTDGQLNYAKLDAAKQTGQDPLKAYNDALIDTYKNYYESLYGGYEIKYKGVVDENGQPVYQQELQQNGNALTMVNKTPLTQVQTIDYFQPVSPATANSVLGQYNKAQYDFLQKLGAYDDTFEKFNADMTTWYSAQDRSSATGMQGLTGNWMDQLGDIPEGELVDLAELFRNTVGDLPILNLADLSGLRELAELPENNFQFDEDAFRASYPPFDPPKKVIPLAFSATGTVCYQHFVNSGTSSCYFATLSYMLQGSTNTTYANLSLKGGGSITGTPSDQNSLKQGMTLGGAAPDPAHAGELYNGRVWTLEDSVYELYNSSTPNGAELDRLSGLIYETDYGRDWVYNEYTYKPALEAEERQYEIAKAAAIKKAEEDARAAYEAEYNKKLNEVLAENNTIMAENDSRMTSNTAAANTYKDTTWKSFEARHALFDAKVDERIDTYSEYLNLTEELRYNVYTQLSTNFAEIPNERDPKTEWYTNLWYRMGGTSETTKSDPNHAYKHIEDKYLDNEAWLQWAIETGTIAMEQVIFNEKGSEEYLNLKRREWKSISYSNSSDIKSEQDQRAITRAEVKYEKTLREIQSKDKQYDNDLKRLDTQHTALQQEYESLKAITDKNIERSFKAFS